MSSPVDRYEQEADRVAEAVMRMPDFGAREEVTVSRLTRASDLQRVSAGCSEVGSTAGAQIEGVRGGGEPLPGSVRAFFEPRFGHDFSRVRVHTGGAAAGSALALNAIAYTVGTNVVFDAGRYAPETSDGRRLLAHELTHVVQQGGVGKRLNGGETADRSRAAVTGCSEALIQRLEGPCRDTPTPHILLVKGSVHPSVREAQRKLNQFHAQERAAGREGLAHTLLVEDCIFGEHTFNAVLSFQQQVFPDQPEEHDGKIGDNTWAKLDSIPTSTADPHEQLMKTADGQSKRLVAGARRALGAVHNKFTPSGTLKPSATLSASDQMTLDAVARWLKVSPPGSMFMDTIVKALNLMNDSLLLSYPVVRKLDVYRARKDPKERCRRDTFAHTDVGVPEHGITCCPRFFVGSEACQRDVMTHERFHLLGIFHGQTVLPDGEIMPAPNPILRTPEQALNGADSMEALTTEIVTGEHVDDLGTGHITNCQKSGTPQV